MKKVFCASLSICFFARLWAATNLHFQWTVEASAPLPYHAEAMQGETFTLSATLHQYGQALSGPATATFYYQTTEMSQTQWYTAPATWTSATGQASLQWSSALDIGHTKYRFFFGIETAQGKNYRAFGTLRLKPSPGFSPATLEPTDVRELFKQEILAELLQSLESTFAPTVHAHDMNDIDGLQSALDGKADAFTVEQTLNESENPVSAKAVYHNLGNVVRNPDITDVIRYLDPNASQIIGNHHGKAIFAASNGDEGGFVVGGSYSSEPRWHQWTARFLWNKIRAYGDPEQYEDYLFTPGDNNQIARKKDLALKQDKLTAGNNITIENGVISAAGGADAGNVAHLDNTETFSGQKTFTKPMIIRNGEGTGSLWIGGNVNSDTATNKQRHLARIVVPSFDDVTKGATLLGFDSSGDSDLAIAGKSYDVVSFGGMKKISNATSPMAIAFCVTNQRGSTSANNKVYPLEMDANEARFNVLPTYKGQTLASTTITDALASRIDTLEANAGDDEPWVSPGDWHLTVRSSEDYATVSTTEVATATQGDRVMGETTVTTHASPIKDVSVEMLDLSMPSAPIPVTFTCEGATLTPSSSACRASATTEGLYRIFATDAQGRTRDAYLNLRTKTKATTTKAYLSDVEGSARKVANDRMLSVLAARDRSHTVAVGQTSAVASCDKAFNGTTPLSTAPLAPTYFCMVEPKTTWGPDAVAVAPHFAVTAAHWQPSATKTATFVTPEGSVSTVSGSTGTSLTAWARANGYSESEIDEADIDDIYVWHFSSGTIPDACIPYVMDVKARETYYKDDLYGIVAYTITQNGYLSYAPLLAADGSRYAFGTFNATTTRADMLEQLAPACCATIYGGDSGRPVLMIHEEKPVLLSTFWTAGSGPSFVKACDILDAYIHQQSGGTEALKRIE